MASTLHLLLSAGLVNGVAAAQDSTSPPVLDREQAVPRCVSILLERQENLSSSEGSGQSREGEACEWPYEGVYRVREGGRRRIPLGYRIGGTSIAAWALLEAPGWSEDAARRSAVGRALDFVLEGLVDPKMSPDFVEGYDVRGWGHVYALQFLLRLTELRRVPTGEEEAVARRTSALVRFLVDSEIQGAGGWNYSRRGDPAAPSTFMTAPALQALFAAAAQGHEVDAGVIRRGLDSLEQARLDSGAFQYSTSSRRTGRGFEAVEGAIGRTSACESTLLLAGRGSVARVRASLEAFFEHWQHLEDRRRQSGTHEPPFMIAPYYFYYAHFYAAQAIQLLPEDQRSPFLRQLDRRLLEVREDSGGWNDRVFDRSENFGTAASLLALLSPDMPRPAGWTGEN